MIAEADEMMRWLRARAGPGAKQKDEKDEKHNINI